MSTNEIVLILSLIAGIILFVITIRRLIELKKDDAITTKLFIAFIVLSIINPLIGFLVGRYYAGKQKVPVT